MLAQERAQAIHGLIHAQCLTPATGGAPLVKALADLLCRVTLRPWKNSQTDASLGNPCCHPEAPGTATQQSVGIIRQLAFKPINVCLDLLKKFWPVRRVGQRPDP